MPPKKPTIKTEFKKPAKIGTLPVKVNAPVTPESVTSQFTFTPKKVNEPTKAGFSVSKQPTGANNFTPAINSVLKETPLNFAKYTMSAPQSKVATVARAKDGDLARFVRDIKGGASALVGDELTTGEKAKAIGMAPVNVVIGLGNSIKDFGSIVLPKALVTGVKMMADNFENNSPVTIDQLNKIQRERLERGTEEQRQKYLAGLQEKRDSANKLARKVSGWASEVITGYGIKQRESLARQGITEDTSIANPQKLGYGVGAGISSIAAYLGTVALTKSPVVASGLLGWVEGSETYNQALNQYQTEGMSKDEAEKKAGAVALTESAGIAVLEKIGMDALFRSYAGGRMRNAAIGAITETLQESTQTTWSNLVAKYGYDKTQSLYEGLFETIITTIPVGAFGGGFSASTDPVLNIDPGLNKPEDFDEEEVVKATEELYKAIDTEVKNFGKAVLDPQAPDTNQALYDDINAEVELRGKDEVIERLVEDAPFEVDYAEATQLVEDAQASAITSSVPNDIMAEINAAAETVTGKKTAVTAVRTINNVPKGESGILEGFPEDALEQAQEAWEDNYAEAYAELENQVQDINKQLKTAKNKEKEALKKQKEELVQEQINQERAFLAEYGQTEEAVTNDKILKAVDEVVQDVSRTLDEDNISGNVNTNEKLRDTNSRGSVRQAGDTAGYSDGGAEQGERRSSDTVDSEDVARGERGVSSGGTGERSERDVKANITEDENGLWLDKKGRQIGSLSFDEYLKDNLEGVGRQRTLNKQIMWGIHDREVRKIRKITADREANSGFNYEKIKDFAENAGSKFKETRENVKNASEEKLLAMFDAVSKMGKGISKEDAVKLPEYKELFERGYLLNDEQNPKSGLVKIVKKIEKPKEHDKAFEALNSYGFKSGFVGQYGGSSSDTFYISFETNNNQKFAYVENFSSYEDGLRRLNQIKQIFSGSTLTDERIELGNEEVVYTEAGVVSTTRTTPIAEKQDSKIGKVLVDIIKNKGQDLRDESLFMVVQVEGYMPLNIERLPTNELAVSHTFIQNGDVMRDPEVVFLIDNTGQLRASTIQMDGIYPGTRPINPKDSFLNLWAGNLKTYVGSKPKEIDAGKVNREQIKKLEADLRAIYIGAGESELEGFLKADEVLSEIMTALEIAEPGNLVFLPNGEVTGYPSTFPDWIPENARNREDLNALISMFKDVRGLSYPSKSTETKRRLFADAFFDEMDLKMKVDTRALRDNILSLYDKDNVTGESEETTEVGQNSAPRDTEGEIRTASGYTNEEVEAIIKDNAYLAFGNVVELTNNRTPVKSVLETINSWQPAGGREAQGAEGRGLLDEYYTPSEVVDMTKTMLAKAGAFSKPGIKVLEPSVGIGNFIYALPEGAKVTGFEINEVSARIAKLNHPEARIVVQPIEELFVDKRGNKKEFNAEYDLIIGNPPYGAHRGLYKGLGEETKINRYENYFMKRSLDLTVDGGFVAMVVPSSFVRSGSTDAGKEQMAALGELVDAVRLPNGSFSTTEIGTDILVFKKSPTKDTTVIERRLQRMSKDAFFLDKANEGKVLGEASQKAGKFGLEDVVKGSVEDAQRSFSSIYETTPAELQVGEVDQTVSVDDVSQATPEKLVELSNDQEVPKVIRETAQREDDRRTNEMVATDEEAQKKEMERLGIKVGDKVQRFQDGEIISGEVTKIDGTPIVHVVTENGTPAPFNENWYKKEEVKALASSDTLDLATLSGSDIESGQWQYVTATGELSGDFDPAKAFYMAGKYYNEFNYAQGNVYERLDTLEKDRKTIGDEQYQKQKAILEAIKPKPMTVERMRLAPHSHFTELVGISTGNLQASFIAWLDKLPMSAFGTSSRRSVKQYVLGEAVRGGDKLQNEQDRRTRRIEGDKLFKVYLSEELSAEDKKKVEDSYNRRFNAYAKPDYTQVPLVSKISATYKNKPLEIRGVQRQGIGFLLNKGVGLLAHDVGLGKTMQGILANIELINRGWAKRPLVVLPSASVYAQWVKDFQALSPNIKLNELSNLGKDFKGDLASLAIPDGTISVITEEGFKKLGFTDKTYEELTKDMLDVIENPNEKKTKRQAELEKSKTEETIGKGIKGTRDDRTFEELGFDCVTVDEIHNYNHIIGSAKAADGKDTEYRGFSQTPSISGLKLWLAAQYVMKNNNGRNVIGLSATPFTNHPLEYYSILSLFARDRMTEMGIRNVNDFMSMYMDVVAKDEVRADGTIASKLDVRGFNNAQQFQALLREFIDFRDGEEAGIVRPDRNSREFVVKENRMSYDYKLMAQELFEIKEAGTLRAMTELQKIAFSPYASQYYTGPIPSSKQFVEGSPKIKLAVELLAETYFTVKDSNHLIYSNRGKEYLPLIKEYLIKEKGIPANQIEIITGDTAKPKRTTIQNDFNAGKVRIVIGNEAIEEGINLQEKTTDLYMLSQPWNFTAVRQVIGRAWRQGNKWRNVRINTFFTENTFDIFLSQAIEKKRVRYQQSLQQGEDYIDSGDIDYEEMKFTLMTDPVLRTRQQYAEKRQRLEQESKRIKADFATKNRRNKEYVDAVAKVNEYKDYLNRNPEANWAKRSLQDAEEKLVQIRKNLSDRGIDVKTIDASLAETEKQIADIGEQLASMVQEEAEAIENAKFEAEVLVDTTGTEDYARHVRDRKEDDRQMFIEGNPMFSLKQNEIDGPPTFSTPEAMGAIVAYHGTDAAFKKFDPERIGESTGAGDWGDGFYFTNDPNVAKTFGKNLMEVRLDLKNPAKNDDLLDQDIQKAVEDMMGFTDVEEILSQKGFDGIEYTHKDGTIEYVVFDANKVILPDNANFSRLQPRDRKGRYSTLAEQRAEARKRGFVPDTDMKRVDRVLSGQTEGMTEAEIRRDRVYTIRMKAGNYEQAKAQLERYMRRFNIKFDVDLADRIFVQGSKVRDKIMAETEAYAVYHNRAITLTPEMAKTTADHEFIHLVIDNIGKIKAFKGFTKESLYTAANKGKSIEGMSATELRVLEEKIAVGFERYLIEKAMDKVARQKKYGKTLADFYEMLKDMVVDLYRNLGGSMGQLADFYDTVARGGEKNEKTVVLLQNPVRKAQVAYQTSEGLKYLDFEELMMSKREIDTAARATYFSLVESLEDNEVMTNKVFQNKNKLNFVMKDLNTLEDMTAQARDIYLKDPEQFAQARAIELIGDEHDADKHRLDEYFADELNPYMKLSQAERAKVNEVLWHGDEEGKEFEPVELLRMDLNDNQIKAYEAVRKSLNMAHEMLLQEMAKKGIPEAEIDNFRQEREGYMPHKWEPKMSTTQKLKSYVTGKDVFVVKHQRKIDGQPKHETYHMDAFASEKEALDAQKYLLENTPNWEESQVRFVVDKLNSLEVDFFASQELTSERMIAVIEQMREKGFVKDEIVELLKKNLVDMFKEKGFGRHYLRRTGVRGYDTENTELVLANYFSGFSGYVTKMRWSTEYFVALSQVDARRQQRYFAWLRDLVAYKLNNQPEWRMARTIAFTWYLANDLSYLLTNTTQNFIVGTGELSKYVEGKDKAWKPEAYLIKAMKDWTTKSISGEEAAAIDGLLQKGQLGAEMTAELMGFKNNPLYREISTLFSKAMFSSTAIVEKNVNRIPAFLAARRIFREQGYSEAIATQKAMDVQNDIHFRYGRIDRPRMLRGRVNVLFIFQNYIRTFLYQLYRDVSRREFISLTRKMGYTMAFGGATALPFSGMIMAVIKSIADDEDDEELKEELTKWDILIQKGIPATFDIDLSGRVGIELLSVTKIADNPTDVRTYLGSIGDLLFKRPFEVMDLFQQERTSEAFAKLLPDMLANPIRAYNGHVYGVRSFAGVPLQDENGDVYKYNTWETILKAAGYTPTQEALLWDAKSREWDANAKKQEERTELSRTIRGMVQRGEFEKARQLQDDAIESGLIAESTDYIRDFASDDWFKEAVSAWESSDKSRERLSEIEDDLIEKVYGGVATDQQRNNARKELAVYRQFGINNPNINDILKAGTNDAKVKVLLEIKDNIGEEAFDELIKKGRTGMYTEAGNRVPILFSDELMKKLKEAEKNNDNQI